MRSSSICIPEELVERNGMKHFRTNAYPTITDGGFLPGDGHIQGIGWCAMYNQYILTAKVASANTACILLYSDYQQSGGQTALFSIKNDAGKMYAHPSGTQVCKDTFPVAIAQGEKDPCYIYFYTVSENAIVKTAAYPDYIEHGTHIGAMAFATIKGYTFMIGLGWDARRIAIWRFEEGGKPSISSLILDVATQSIVDKDSIDTNVGAYNSCWLGYVERTGQYVLFASHGSGVNTSDNWMDIWELQGLTGEPNRISMKKIAKKKLAGHTKHGMRSLFFEGMTMRVEGENLSDVRVLAVPHDFGQESAPDGERAMAYLYEGYFYY